jgi:hypothetical protein
MHLELASGVVLEISLPLVGVGLGSNDADRRGEEKLVPTLIILGLHPNASQ